MSLINQMLQDLDARRSESTGGSQFGQQVRSVSASRRTHSVWWVALGAILVGAAMMLFLLLRPHALSSASQPLQPQVPAQPPAQGVPAGPQGQRLPLKLDSDLGGNAGSETFGSPAFTPPAASLPGAVGSMPREASEGSPHAPAPRPSAQLQPAVPVPEEKLAPKALPISKVEPRAALAPAEEAVQAPAPKAPARSPSLPLGTDSPREAVRQVKEVSPQQRAENAYRKALSLIEQGRAIEASPLLEEILRLDQRHSGARQALIGIMIDQNRLDEASRLAREGLAADSAQPNLAMILARLQVEQSELRPAIETLERSLPYAGEHSDYLAFLAALLQRAERHKQAVDLYVKALQRSPQNGLWWMGMAISLQADQRKAEAAEAFRRAKASGSLSPELQAFVDSRQAQLR